MSIPQPHRFVAQLGNDELTFESGVLAGQAGGAVTVRSGDSMLLAAATASKNIREGIDFFPLSVEFEEKLYAAGRIPGSFFRREGRPSEEAILTCRLTDRMRRRVSSSGSPSRQDAASTAWPSVSDGSG